MPVAAIFGLVATVCAAGPARADSLYDAFRAAYATNPTIGSQRAAVRVGVQDQALAATGFMPSVAGTADYGYRDRSGKEFGGTDRTALTHPRGYGVTLNQNLWNGFKTTNTVRRESASLAAARDALRGTEQKILTDVATAYADVMRDTAILALRRSDMDVLATRANETRLKYKIGDLTRTDVDQSEAALARSRADFALADANLLGSKAVFRAVVGREPGRLEPAAFPERLIPQSLPAAIEIALRQHPSIRSAMQKVRAAEANIAVEKAGWAPSLDFVGTAEKRWSPDYYSPKTETANYSVVGKVSVPIFDRGVTLTSVRRASELAGQQEMILDAQRAEIQASVIQAWGLVVAARSVMASAEAQIAASDRALTGVQLEAGAGQRTTLDILNAQRSLVDARVYRETAHRDRLVAGYKLLAAIGRLSLEEIRPDETRGRALYVYRSPTSIPIVRRLPERMEEVRATGSIRQNGMADAPEEARPTPPRLALDPNLFRPEIVTPRIFALAAGDEKKIAFASGTFTRTKVASLSPIPLGFTSDLWGAGPPAPAKEPPPPAPSAAPPARATQRPPVATPGSASVPTSPRAMKTSNEPPQQMPSGQFGDLPLRGTIAEQP